MKKVIYLGLALLLPGLVFVFLKYAGSNRFDIPIYYEDGKPDGNPCGFVDDEPYLLPEAMSEGLLGGKQACVLIFPERGVAPRVIEAMLVNEIGPRFSVVDASEVSTDSVQHMFRDCIFFVVEPTQAVLFDNKRQIRGYYDLSKRDEMDRLRVELKILLEKY